MTDANGLPLSVVVAGANTHDIKLVEDTLDALQTGKPGRRLRLCMDKGYDCRYRCKTGPPADVNLTHLG